ncbi:MAG: hypothetical protein J6N70_14295 [Oribacterium sp.]|nr:hypothetical protein [Oribacterium sp.]
MNEVVVSQKKSLYDRATDIGAKALFNATNLVGRAMCTRAGKIALAMPLAMTLATTRVYANPTGGGGGDSVDAQGMIDAIMGVLQPGVIALGSLVAIVGGIQLGVAFKDENPDGKTRGFQTLIGGAIIAAVGALVPASLSLG